ncbi:MAG: hypothetical protein HFJ28_02275, partial [Clostridia bacterium]|nr:hypothetical protein [Clostridia bacterium]
MSQAKTASNVQRKIAILLIIAILLQLFSPYTQLVGTVKAAITGNTAPDFKYLVMNVDKSEDAYLDYEDFGIAHITLELRGNLNFSGFDVAFSYDKNVLKPTYNAGSSRRPDYVEATNMSDWDVTTNNFGSDISENNTWLFADQGKFRVEGTTATDKNPSVIGQSVVIAELYFLLEDGYTLDNIPSTTFAMQPGGGLETGIKLVFDTYDWVTDPKYYGTDGMVEAEKEISSITVKTNPTKTSYEHGEAINLAGGVITVTYSDNSEEDIDMLDPKVSIISGNLADATNNTVMISYGGKQTSFDITVTDPIEKLEVQTPMTNVEYNHNDNFNFAGLQLKATKKSGNTITLGQEHPDVTTSELKANINSNQFTQTSTSGTVPVSGTQKIIFTYEGKTAEQTVIVNDTIDTIEVVNQPTKKVYKYGESLNLAGASIRVHLGSGGTSNINLPDGGVTVTNFNNKQVGSKQHLNVSFGGKTAANTIEVEAYNYVKTIDLTPPTNRKPIYNTQLDLTGASITENWANGNIAMNKAVTASMISGYNKTKLGSQTVTVNYTVTYTLSDGNTLSDNFTKTFTVNVQNTAKAIEITPPTKTTYHHGETLNLAGGSIKVTNQDNTVANVAMTTAMITENGASVNMSPATYDNTNKVVKTLKIAYEQDGITKQVDYPITIINDVKSISLQGTPKTNYNVNDPRDTNLEILVSRAAGTPEVIKVTDAMIANFSTTTEGARTAVITYTENGITKTVDYSYVVADKVKSISIKTMPKETQKYNTNLDLANATIEVVKGSKTETIPLTSAMIKTGTYDKTTLGTQVVTVEYGTKEDGSPATTTFTVNVKDYVTGISITPNEVNAVYNDELQTILDNNTITYTVTYAKAGAQIATVVTQNMVTGYNKTKIGAQTLTVTYTDNNENSFTKDGTFTANLKVTIPDKVTQISITKPNKTTYKHGEAFNLTGGIINLTYASTKTDTVNLTTAMLKEADGVTTASTSPLATDFGTNTTFDKSKNATG